MRKLLLTIALLLGLIGFARADVDLSYHIDTRGYNTFGVVTGGEVSKNVKFWGFTDIHGSQDPASNRVDTSHYFMEYRLNYDLVQVPGSCNGLALEAEYNDFAGFDNSLVRLGFTYSTSLMTYGWIQFRWHPWDTNKDKDSQVSSAFGFPLNSVWSVSAWIDYDIKEYGKNQWVYEPALNLVISDNLTLSVEYRWNGYEEATTGWDGEGVAVGLVWKL